MQKRVTASQSSVWLANTMSSRSTRHGPRVGARERYAHSLGAVPCQGVVQQQLEAGAGGGRLHRRRAHRDVEQRAVLQAGGAAKTGSQRPSAVLSKKSAVKRILTSERRGLVLRSMLARDACTCTVRRGIDSCTAASPVSRQAQQGAQCTINDALSIVHTCSHRDSIPQDTSYMSPEGPQ